MKYMIKLCLFLIFDMTENWAADKKFSVRIYTRKRSKTYLKRQIGRDINCAAFEKSVTRKIKTLAM